MDLQEAFDAGFEAVKGYIDDRFAALEKRIAEIETAGGGLKYQGVWQRALQYRKGTFVTFNGSLWCAVRDTQSEPAISGDWQLAVKAGRDGKDAR